MRGRRLVVVAVGLAFGITVEWAEWDDAPSRALAAADLAVGCLLIACGAVAWDRRAESRVGPLMTLAGFTWFLGTLWATALYLHRGPLVHLHLSYPTGRVPGRAALVVVTAAYVDAAIEPLASNDVLTLALSGAVALTAVQVFARTSGPARKAGGPALAAALAFAGVLALGAVDRLAGWDADRAVLWAYDVVIASVAIVLLVDLLRGRWTEAVVTGLVVDLGAGGDGATLRAKLASALGDPSLVVGYRLAVADSFVDDAGRPVDLPAPESGRAMTRIDDRGESLAVLVHDAELLTDRRLVESVAAAARVAVANARLQAEAQTRAGELEASRRRIVEAADAQRRRLEEQLRLGAERRLETVATLLADARGGARADGQAIEGLEGELAETRRELREFAQGVHPAALAERGLMPALRLLAERSPIPVEIVGEVGTLTPPVEAAMFFVCSEALANTSKHADATGVRIELEQRAGDLVLTVADDGVGGADLAQGTGLRGLVDRVHALGGTLGLESEPGRGTRVEVRVPTARDATAR
jgi:signal transduction histidine kinase